MLTEGTTTTEKETTTTEKQTTTTEKQTTTTEQATTTTGISILAPVIFSKVGSIEMHVNENLKIHRTTNNNNYRTNYHYGTTNYNY